MVLIRCTLPASDLTHPYPPPSASSTSLRAHSLLVSPQFPTQFPRYTPILIYHVLHAVYLQLVVYRSPLSLVFSLTLSLKETSFLYSTTLAGSGHPRHPCGSTSQPAFACSPLSRIMTARPSIGLV